LKISKIFIIKRKKLILLHKFPFWQEVKKQIHLKKDADRMLKTIDEKFSGFLFVVILPFLLFFMALNLPMSV